jgi:hypothetical protein
MAELCLSLGCPFLDTNKKQTPLSVRLGPPRAGIGLARVEGSRGKG